MARKVLASASIVLLGLSGVASGALKDLCISGQSRIYGDSNKNGVFETSDAFLRFQIDGDTIVMTGGNGIDPNPAGSCRNCAFILKVLTNTPDKVEIQEIGSFGTFVDYNNPSERFKLTLSRTGAAAGFDKLDIAVSDPGSSSGRLVRQSQSGLQAPPGLYDTIVGTTTRGQSFTFSLSYGTPELPAAPGELAPSATARPAFEPLVVFMDHFFYKTGGGSDTSRYAIPTKDGAITIEEGSSSLSPEVAGAAMESRSDSVSGTAGAAALAPFACGRELFRIPLNPDATNAPPAQVVPIVLDVASGAARFTTELSLANPSTAAASVSLAYTASLGAKEGSGSAPETIPAGAQLIIPDVITYLRAKGLAIPATGAQGGALVVTTTAGGPPSGVVATARTATDTGDPNPVGRAGLAYGGVPAAGAITTSATIYGLRSTTADRSNLAIFNMGSDPVSLKVTAFSGEGDGRQVEVASAGSPLTLPGNGWFQYNEILGSNGIVSGYVTIERVSATGSFNAYGIVNDNPTSDGSFVPPAVATATGTRLTLPVLVETSAFRSEMVLANRGTAAATFTLRYVESLSPAAGAGGTVTVTLAAGRQLIIPDAIDYLRRNGATLGASGAGSYAGGVRVTVSGVPLSATFIGARTASQAPGGGQFGLFTPGLYSGQEATVDATIYGLQQDARNRTNVAVLHAGDDGTGPITLRLQAISGVNGSAAGAPLDVTLQPGGWAQPGGFFAGAGIANGYVHVRRTSGTAPFVAYGVVNDGASPAERTGDGAYVSAVLGAPGAAVPEDGSVSGPDGISFTSDSQTVTGTGYGTVGLLSLLLALTVFRMRRSEMSGPAGPGDAS